MASSTLMLDRALPTLVRAYQLLRFLGCLDLGGAALTHLLSNYLDQPGDHCRPYQSGREEDNDGSDY
jgi:hypothetical protein